MALETTTTCSTFLEMIPLDMLVTTVQVGGLASSITLNTNRQC